MYRFVSATSLSCTSLRDVSREGVYCSGPPALAQYCIASGMQVHHWFLCVRQMVLILFGKIVMPCHLSVFYVSVVFACLVVFMKT